MSHCESCKNCERMAVNCHSVCQDYINWKTKWEEQKQHIQKQKDFDQNLRSFEIASVRKRKKRINKY